MYGTDFIVKHAYIGLVQHPDERLYHLAPFSELLPYDASEPRRVEEELLLRVMREDDRAGRAA